MTQETLTYTADGLTMKSQLVFEPGQAKRPAVLVFPEAFGLSEHAIGRAQRLASMGYVALAADLHGDAHLEDDLPKAIGLIKPMMDDPSKTRARAKAAMQALLARPEVDPGRIAAIGFCFGGTMALELARSGAEIRAAVGFHSGLGSNAPADPETKFHARVLVCIGADDPMISPDSRSKFEQEMRHAKVDWQMHLYGDTVHSFTNEHASKRGMPDAIRYNADADKRSWEAMTDLFKEALA